MDGTAQWISLSEASKRTGLSTRTIRRAIRLRLIHAVRGDGPVDPWLVDGSIFRGPRTMRIQEAALLLRRSAYKTRKLVRQGRIREVVWMGRERRVVEEDVLRVAREEGLL